MTDDPRGPIEDDLEDETKQDPSTDLPEPLVGNEEEDDMPDEPADTGEPDTEGEDVKQDGQTG